MMSQKVSLTAGLLKNNRESSWGPFRRLLRKEISDHIRNWRLLILVILILLTFVSSMYGSLSSIKAAFDSASTSDTFYYLKLFTLSDNSIPPFHVFLSFLAPILGISFGFDAINAEYNRGTMLRLMAQPIYRDKVILVKFIAPLVLVSVLFFALTFFIIGFGMVKSGVPMDGQEWGRIIAFNIMTILYVGFWLSLSILLSIRYRQAATSALLAIGIWLFFTLFYPVVVSILVKSFLPDPRYISPERLDYYNTLILDLLRISPSQLYVDSSTTLLMPMVRSLGPVSMEQMVGAIPNALSLRNSLLLVWPQLSCMIAFTLFLFALSYALFMRKELRS